MTDTVPDPARPPAAPPKRRGCFGVAAKTFLGCAAFSLGAIVVLVLCLPWFCSGLARSITEKTFGELFHGSLAVADLDLSWWGEQKIQDAVLYDPDKKEVARVSAVLPSLLDLFRMEGPMKIAVTLDADLSADDAGVSNLQRAIEPRQPRRPDESPGETGGTGPLAQIERLDVEATLTSRRLSWSDADTRRRGQPFEVRDLNAALAMKPGKPITFQAKGQVVSDTPGALEVDATIHGPIEVGKPWPLGVVDANVRIEKFSTAMIDGVAGLQGKLVEVIGTTFDLKVAIAQATPHQGGIELAFQSERTNLDFAGNFDGGVLRSRDGSPVKLVLGVPKGFVNDLVAPMLPPDTTVSWVEGERPWSVTIGNLALPIPEAGGMADGQMARTFERLAADVDVDLPARAVFENAETRAAKIQAAIDGVRMKVHCAPGEPLTARLETALETGDRGRIVAEASVPEPWKAFASGVLPAIDASVAVEGVSMRAVDALAGQGGRIAEAVGPTIAMHLDARAAGTTSGNVTASVESARLKLRFQGRLDAGALRCTGDEGLDLSWDPPAGFVDAQAAAQLPPGMRVTTAPGPVAVRAREISAPVLSAGQSPGGILREAACDLRVTLPGARFTSEGMAPMTLGKTELAAKLQPGGSATFSLAVPLDAGAPGRIAIDGSAANVLLGAASPFEVKLVVEGVATAPIDALAGQEGLLVAALGPTLTLGARATGTGPKIAASAEVTTPTTALRASIEKEGDLVRATGEQGIFLTTRPPEAAWSRLIGAHLPEGAALSIGDGSQALEISVRELSVQLPPAAAPGAAPASSFDLVQSLACEARVKLGSLRYADANTRAAKVDLTVRDLDVGARVAPGKPLAATVAAVVSTAANDEGGRLDATATVPDPWFFLRGPEAKLPPIDADLRFTGIPVALVDGLAGRPGIATGLFGERADLVVTAAGASPDGGTFRAKITSPGTILGVAGRLEKGVVVAVDEPALEVNATLSQAWLDALLGPKLPAGARVGLVDAKQPLRAVVSDLRLPLPSGGMDAAALAAASLRAVITVPDIAYTDPKTDGAKVPAVVRGLEVTADLAPGKPPNAAVKAVIEGEPAGEITATVRALDPPALLAEADGTERFRIAMDVRAKSVPTGLVDALADQAGLLVDVLGATLDLTLHSDGISMREGTFTAAFESPQAKVTCDRAGMKERVIYVEKVGSNQEAILARAGLTPLFSERIVGNLVPMLVDLQQAPGAEPVSLAVEELRMPLDADLSKLDALVRVHLGKVTYKLLPGIDHLLGGGSQVVDVPEIRVPIQKGVASYEGLPIRIAGKDYPFKGTFSLVDKSFKMETQVPLSALGKNISDKLDSARSFLDPNTKVPLELRGTWKSPKLRVGDEFLKKVVEDALKKQGGSLLEGLLKKKN